MGLSPLSPTSGTPYVARTTVGISLIYLFIKGERLFTPGGTFEVLLARPNKIRDLFAELVATLILTWAGLQVLELYLYLFIWKK